MGKRDHVVIGKNSVRCLNCGTEQTIAMPCSLGVFAAIGKAFGAEHAQCKPSEAGKRRMQATTPHEWLQGWDTGLSSETIWHHMMHGSVRRVSIPYDPSDFGRCYRLLALFPEWRERLHEMDAYPQWRPFVAAWPQMEVLWNEESQRADKRAPKLYALMQQCVEQATAQPVKPPPKARVV